MGAVCECEADIHPGSHALHAHEAAAAAAVHADVGQTDSTDEVQAGVDLHGHAEDDHDAIVVVDDHVHKAQEAGHGDSNAEVDAFLHLPSSYPLGVHCTFLVDEEDQTAGDVVHVQANARAHGYDVKCVDEHTPAPDPDDVGVDVEDQRGASIQHHWHY